MVRVNIAKLNIIPRVMPRGFFFSPVVEDDRTIGKRGQMHGARMVINPETKEKKSRINTNLLSQKRLALANFKQCLYSKVNAYC